MSVGILRMRVAGGATSTCDFFFTYARIFFMNSMITMFIHGVTKMRASEEQGTYPCIPVGRGSEYVLHDQ